MAGAAELGEGHSQPALGLSYLLRMLGCSSEKEPEHRTLNLKLASFVT